MPTESTTFSSYSSHNNLVYESSLYESIFKGDIAPLNFKNLRLTGFLEHPSKLSQALLLDLLSNRLIIPNKDKKTLDNE